MSRACGVVGNEASLAGGGTRASPFRPTPGSPSAIALVVCARYSKKNERLGPRREMSAGAIWERTRTGWRPRPPRAWLAPVPVAAQSPRCVLSSPAKLIEQSGLSSLRARSSCPEVRIRAWQSGLRRRLGLERVAPSGWTFLRRASTQSVQFRGRVTGLPLWTPARTNWDASLRRRHRMPEWSCRRECGRSRMGMTRSRYRVGSD